MTGLDGRCSPLSLPPPRPCWPRWAWRMWTRTWPWRCAPAWCGLCLGHRAGAGQARRNPLARPPHPALSRLSGLATGLSWICYFRALQLGPASRVAPLDKLSVPLVMVFAWLLLGEKLNPPPRRRPAHHRRSHRHGAGLKPRPALGFPILKQSARLPPPRKILNDAQAPIRSYRPAASSSPASWARAKPRSARSWPPPGLALRRCGRRDRGRSRRSTIAEIFARHGERSSATASTRPSRASPPATPPGSGPGRRRHRASATRDAAAHHPGTLLVHLGSRTRHHARPLRRHRAHPPHPRRPGQPRQPLQRRLPLYRTAHVSITGPT
jgi:hypothetical protein